MPNPSTHLSSKFTTQGGLVTHGSHFLGGSRSEGGPEQDGFGRVCTLEHEDLLVPLVAEDAARLQDCRIDDRTVEDRGKDRVAFGENRNVKLEGGGGGPSTDRFAAISTTGAGEECGLGGGDEYVAFCRHVADSRIFEGGGDDDDGLRIE